MFLIRLHLLVCDTFYEKKTVSVCTSAKIKALPWHIGHIILILCIKCGIGKLKYKYYESNIPIFIFYARAFGRLRSISSK